MKQRDRGRRTPETYDHALHLISSGQRLTPEEIALLLERNPDTPLPARFRQHLVGLLRGKAALPRGRRPMSRARLAWIMIDAIELYFQKLREFRLEDMQRRKRAKAAGEALPRGEAPPNERAARHVLREMRDGLGNIGVKRLLNLVSIFNRPMPVEDQAPPDEFDPPDHLPAPKPWSPPRTCP